MDLSKLSAELKYVEINGVTLNIDERTRIGLGCMELANSIKTDKMCFWGKIRGKSTTGVLYVTHFFYSGFSEVNNFEFLGTIKDYYIVYTCTETLPAANLA